MSETAVAVEHHADHAHDHHGSEGFLSKYVFSTDHKMIAMPVSYTHLTLPTILLV